MSATRRMLRRQIGTAGAVLLALAAVLLYSAWGATVLAAEHQASTAPAHAFATTEH